MTTCANTTYISCQTALCSASFYSTFLYMHYLVITWKITVLQTFFLVCEGGLCKGKPENL